MKWDYEWAQEIHHIPFGLYLQRGKKCQLEKEKSILLEEVIEEVIQLAEEKYLKQKILNFKIKRKWQKWLELEQSFSMI